MLVDEHLDVLQPQLRQAANLDDGQPSLRETWVQGPHADAQQLGGF
jgi:hypothetical protein